MIRYIHFDSGSTPQGFSLFDTRVDDFMRLGHPSRSKTFFCDEDEFLCLLQESKDYFHYSEDWYNSLYRKVFKEQQE